MNRHGLKTNDPRQWCGISVERDPKPAGEDEHGGATIRCASFAAQQLLGNLMGLVFQYALVIAKPVQDQAVALVNARIESGDSRVCYVQADLREDTKSAEIADEVARISAERAAIRLVIRRVNNAF